MKNVILYSLPLLVAGSMYCSAVGAASIIPTAQQKPANELLNSLKQKRHVAPRAKVVGFRNASAKSTATPYAKMSGAEVNFLSDEEGNVWYYTQNTTYKDGSWGAAISKAEITIYDEKHQQAGTITVDVPEDMNVNEVTPYGTVTKKFFDLNGNDSELLVELHETGNQDNNYQGKYHTYVYHLDGTKAAEYEGTGVFLNIVKNAWTKYQRFVLTDAKYEAVDGKTYDDGSPYMTTMAHINIYKPASWGSSEPAVEKEFTVDEDYTYYGNDEVPVTIYNVGGDPYYVISHYSKIYDSGETDTETGFFIPTKDNSVVIKTYDKNYTLVDDLNIPIPAADDTQYRMAQIGNFEDWSVSKGMFTDDGNLAYVVTYYDMTTKVDDYRYSFVAYDHEGNKIGDICTGVYNTWFKLNSIPGEEEQVAFMQYVDDDESQQQIKIVNLPSFSQTVTMPAYIDDNLISTVFNRYGSGDSYKYIMKLSQGDIDNDGNVIAKVAWLNPDLSVDRYTKFNLGQQAENFMLTLADTYINPYLFNTNDKMEFFFQAKVKKEGSTALDNVYMIGDEDGNILHRFAAYDKGAITSMGCYNSGEGGNELYVSYSKDDNKTYDLDFYKLPLTKFDKGGDGTKENPYLVSTAGDLAQISSEPSANYKLVADINFDNAYNNVNKSWTPIAGFSGTFDGDNHSIDNLYLNSDESNVGLFADMQENAEVKNLILTHPTIELTDQNSTAGVLAASTMKTNVNNVHVYCAEISGDADGTIGGLVGQAAYESNLSGVSFNDSQIKTPNASSVGGIAGDVRTSTVVEAAAVSDVDVNAASTVGGVVGSAMNSTVKNSRFSGSLTAENTVGGIIGSNSETITDKCIFDGTVNATRGSWSGLSAAGIIGSLAADWSESTTPIVTNNIVRGEINATESSSSDDLEEGEETKEDNTVHRIVGHTIADEYYEDGETPKTEKRLSNNWAVNTTTVKGKVVSSTDENSVEGYDAAPEDISNESLSQIGFSFGTTVDAPWKDSGDMFPVLFFENEAKSVILSESSLTMAVGNTRQLSASVFGVEKADFKVASSNENVVGVNVGTVDDDYVDMLLTAKAAGTAEVSVTAGNITVSCPVTVIAATGIAEVAADGGNALRILPGIGCIKADGASNISIYAANGSRVAKADGSQISTSQIGKGVFVVVAVDANGNRQTAKVVIK